MEFLSGIATSAIKVITTASTNKIKNNLYYKKLKDDILKIEHEEFFNKFKNKDFFNRLDRYLSYNKSFQDIILYCYDSQSGSIASKQNTYVLF